MLAAMLAAAAANAALAEEPAWKGELREKVTHKVSFDFVETPFTEALSFFQTLTRVNMILDPQALRGRERTAVTLKVEDMVLEKALKRVVKLANLDYALLDDAVFVSTPERLAKAVATEEARRRVEARAREAEEPAWKREIREQLARRVTFEFVETPLTEVIPFLQMLTKMSIILDPDLDRSKREITLRVTKMTLARALRWMLRLVELDYILKDGAVFISTPGKIDAESSPRIEAATWEDELRRALGRKVSFDFVDTPLTHAISFLQTVSKANMFLDPHALRKGDNAPVTLKVKDMVLEEALKRVVKLADLDYALIDEAVFVSTPERLAEVRSREESRRAAEAKASEHEGWNWERAMKRVFARKVTFEFVDTPLSEAMSFLQTLTKVSMILDPKATEGREEPITLRATNMALGPAFRWMLRLADLDCTYKNGAIFVSTLERIDAERRFRAETVCRGVAQPKGRLVSALEREVSFEFVDMTLAEALDFLRRKAGVKMVFSPGAIEVCRYGTGTISLEVTDSPLRVSLDWLLKLGDLEYSLGEDAVHIFMPGERAPIGKERADGEPF